MLLFAFVISALATGFLTALFNVFIAPFIREKELKKAQKSGRVIKALLIDVKGGNDVESRHFVEIWDYEHNGKKYKYKNHITINTDNRIGNQEYLYYKRFPSKAKNKDNFGNVEYMWKLVWLVLFVVFYLILKMSFEGWLKI